MFWWAHPDSNREPKDYESPAPPLSYRPVLHVDYCTRKLSSQENFIYPHCRQTPSHGLRDRVDQRGARGRRLLRVGLRLLRLSPVLGPLLCLLLGSVLHACLLLAPCGAPSRPVRGTSCMKKATRADGLNQQRPRDGAIADCLLSCVCLLRRPRVRCATRRPGPRRRGRRRMRARRNPRPCACASSLPRISPRPS